MAAASDRERVQFWRDPTLADLEVLRARYITHSFSRHTHEGYAIGVIEAGVEEFYYRGAMHQARAGELVIIHPGEVHTGHAGISAGWSYRMLYPAVELVQQALPPGCRGVPFFPDTVICDRILVHRFRQMHQRLGADTPQLERESWLLDWLGALLERHGEQRRGLPTPAVSVEAVRDYLHAHSAEAITLEQLAALVQLTPLQLLRRFRRLTGLPPHAYLVQLRVQRAKGLLGAGRPIAAVAADTGFADQSHLHRHFKRVVGVTPGQYLRGCR